MKTFSVYMTDEQYSILVKNAKQNGISKNAYILSLLFPVDNQSQQSAIDGDKILKAIEDLKQFDNIVDIKKYISKINQSVAKINDLYNWINEIHKCQLMLDHNSRLVLNHILVKILNTMPKETAEENYKAAFANRFWEEYNLPEFYRDWTLEHNQLFKKYLSDRYAENKRNADNLIPPPKD